MRRRWKQSAGNHRGGYKKYGSGWIGGGRIYEKFINSVNCILGPKINRISSGREWKEKALHAEGTD